MKTKNEKKTKVSSEPIKAKAKKSISKKVVEPDFEEIRESDLDFVTPMEMEIIKPEVITENQMPQTWEAEQIKKPQKTDGEIQCSNDKQMESELLKIMAKINNNSSMFNGVVPSNVYQDAIKQASKNYTFSQVISGNQAKIVVENEKGEKMESCKFKIS